MKKAIYTLCIGEDFNRIAELTHPRMEAYAKKIGADFIVIKDRVYPDTVPVGYEKLQLKEALGKYDRICFIDTDILIRSDSPDIFVTVPYGLFSAFNEGEWILSRLETLKESFNTFKQAIPLKPGATLKSYYNTGVMVFDKTHAAIFSEPEVFVDNFGEQTWLNLQIHRELDTQYQIKNLSHRFNRMSHLDEVSNETCLENYFIHYAGMARINIPALLAVMKEDLGQWEEMSKSNYIVRRKYKVSVGGGLGDQIETEPVIREIKRLYPNDEIVVASHWPELFEDLDYEVTSIDIRKPVLDANEFSAVFHTYANPDQEAWKYMTHVFAHSTDFASQLAIRRVLPPEKKRVQLRYTESQLASVEAKMGSNKETWNTYICVHPGRSWRTKTMPPEYWSKLVFGLNEFTKVVLIGKDGKELQGILDIDLSQSPNVIDMRDKLSLKETLALLDNTFGLVTNDSAPLHLAGATDAWIFGVYTAKHAALVTPYRNQMQGYRHLELNTRPECWPCNVNARTTDLDECRADFCMNQKEEQLYQCYPKAEVSLKAIQFIWKTETNSLIRNRAYLHGVALKQSKPL